MIDVEQVEGYFHHKHVWMIGFS